MAGYYHLTHEPPTLLVLRVYGVLEPEAARTLMHEMHDYLDQVPDGVGLLLDVRQAESMSMAVREYVFGQMMHMRKLLAYAVLCLPPPKPSLDEIMAQAAGMAPRMRTFRDEADARAWLLDRLG